MGSAFSKWIYPLIITVVVGTIAALFFAQSNIETELTENSTALIGNVGDHTAGEWAKITFSGRDGTLTGTTTDPSAADALIAQISTLHGVRSITSEIILARMASPYPFTAVLENGEISLTGGVPSLSARDALLEQTGATDGGLSF